MKALPEFNAMYLLAKNYERMNCIQVRGDRDGETIIVSNVPEPLVDWFADKINKLVVREASKAYNEVEKSAEQFIAAATSASPSTD